MLTVILVYFGITNKDIFKHIASNLDKQLKKNKVNRLNVLHKLNVAQHKKIEVNNYLEIPLKFRKTPLNIPFDKEAILTIFDQNQLNAIIIQIICLGFVLLMGIYRDVPYVQVPAATSVVLYFTIAMMIAGALIYWLRGWAISLVFIIFILISFVFSKVEKKPYHQAFGLDYSTQADYSFDNLVKLTSKAFREKDKKETIEILNNWKKKEINKGKPVMVFICASGGGQRAGLWSLKALQAIDSTINGTLLDRTMMMTGASGGLIGASYYRELFLRKKQGENIDLFSQSIIDKMGMDKLNPMVFSLVVGDLLFRFQKFTYNNKVYYKDRGYSLEHKFLIDFDSVLNKSIYDYKEPEVKSLIPLLIIAPTVVNDGRKLFISPQHISYLCANSVTPELSSPAKIKGIEFLRVFEQQKAKELRFITALRMNATFPYVTPSVILPSSPKMEIMDAGLSDNFGVTDAIRFVHVFKDWVEANTSGILLINIRDISKEAEILHYQEKLPFNKILTPIENILGKLNNLQDIANDNVIEYTREWLKVPVHTVDFNFIKEDFSPGASKNVNNKASLSWRLTTKERRNIEAAMYSEDNQLALKKINAILFNKSTID